MSERLTEGSRAAQVEGREETSGQPLRASGIAAAQVRRMIPRGEHFQAGTFGAESLHSIGIDFGKVRDVVESSFGAGALESAPVRRVALQRPRRPRFAPETTRLLQYSLRVAIELHDEMIQPGHLLLGLLRVNGGFANTVLEQAGTSVAGFSSVVLTQLTGH